MQFQDQLEDLYGKDTEKALVELAFMLDRTKIAPSAILTRSYMDKILTTPKIESCSQKDNDVRKSDGSSRKVFLRCRHCKSTDVTFTQKQTRSADESMTLFCRCAECGKAWRH